jgi:hypothetical protein
VRCIRPFLIAVVCWLGLASSATAHDIPADVAAQLLVRPSGDQLQLLVRVPLKAIRDLEFPELPGGYLDVERLSPRLPDAAKVWIADFVEIHEGNTRLAPPLVAATRLSLESDRSFASINAALAHFQEPNLTSSSMVVWNQVMFDVLLEYRIQSDRSRFSIRPGLDRLATRVVTVVRFVAPANTVRVYQFTGDPGLVPLDPRWHQAALRFVHLGFVHILDGTDHLLFLLCLVIPLRRLRPLILVVTAFTIAHSITLIASVYQLAPDELWFSPLIETLIAISIVYMALENIVAESAAHRRWMMAFGFGLVHGFGFSFALRETLQFAGSHLAISLVSFNIGVELGQLLVLILLVPALRLTFRFVVAERMGTIILSALVAHTGWHWMMERAERLSQFPFQWPAFRAAMLAGSLRWLLVILTLAGGVRLLLRLRHKPPPHAGLSEQQD